MTGRRLLERLGLHRPELRAWALYDWANSAFVLLIITAIFPVYYRLTPASGLTPASATATYGWATSISLAIVAILAPFWGAMADRLAIRKLLLGICVVTGALTTALLVLPGPGDWLPALVLFGIANLAVTGSFVFYDSLLPHIASGDELDRVSAGGFALGYLGSGLLLLVAVAAIEFPATFGLPDAGAATRASFIAVALWWTLFAVPLFRRVQEPPPISPAPEGKGGHAAAALSGLAVTWRELRRNHRDAFRLLIAIMFYNEGIGTIIRMAALYAAGIGIGQSDIIGAILLVQFVGVPFSFLLGNLAGRIGTKNTILLGLAVYALICIVAYRMQSTEEFYLLALLVATVQGGTQALSRSLFSSMIPRVRSAELFGYYALFEKVSGFVGPALFGMLALAAGSSRSAILSVLAFFVVGAAMLMRTNVARGRAVAET